MRNIAVVGNAANTLIHFRLDLIKDLVKIGYKVFAFSPSYSSEEMTIVRDVGAIPISYKIHRTSVNPVHEFLVILELKALFQENKIEAIISYFVKPVIYSSIAGKLAKVNNINSMIAGLGYSFTENPNKGFDLKRSILKKILSLLFKISFRYNRKVFFQNIDDLSLFVKKKIVNSSQAVRVFGSGVHLDRYQFSNPIVNPITFITTGRLIEEKGFIEFVEAASSLKRKYENLKFVILGGLDENPKGLNKNTLNSWVQKGIVEWPGKVDNVQQWLKESSVFVLASYYREGTPRSILEALAIGRPVITTDHPGCRETVVEGENGFLVSIKDSYALEKAMEKFIINPELVNRMGIKSRKIAEEKYDVRKVNQVMINAMGLNQNL